MSQTRFCLWLLSMALSVVAGAGCDTQPAPETPTATTDGPDQRGGADVAPSQVVTLPTATLAIAADNTVTVVDAAETEQPVETVAAGALLKLKGAFRLQDGEDVIPSVMILNVVGKNRKGGPAIIDGYSTRAEKVGEDRLTYAGEVTAPRRAGTYQLEVVYRDTTVNTWKLRVK